VLAVFFWLSDCDFFSALTFNFWYSKVIISCHFTSNGNVAQRTTYCCCFLSKSNKMLGYRRDRAAGSVSFWQKWKTIAAIVQILDTLRFWAPFGGLGTTYDVHRLRRFERILIENPRFRRVGSVSATFSRRRRRPPRTIFVQTDRSVNALQLCRWQYSHKETLWQTFFKWSAILDEKRPFYVFEPNFGRLQRAMFILGSLESA